MMRLGTLSLSACTLLLASLAIEANQQPTISAELYKKLQTTDRLIAEKAYGKAQQQLQTLLNDAQNGSLDQAAVLRSLASVHALQEHYAKAADLLAKAVNLHVLPDAQQQDALFNLGQLYLASGRYSQAIETLQPWLAKNPVPDVQTHVLLANAYTQLKQHRKALTHIGKAIRMSPKPEPSWYQLQLALLYELKDYQAAEPVLRQLISNQPDNKEYWNQLVSVYQQLKQYTRAASIKHLAYRKGIIDSERDILDLVNSFLYAGAPYKAATILQAELNAKKLPNTAKNWELLANAWLQAREQNKAIVALERASQLEDKGGLYLQLGQIYFEQKNWAAAINSLNKAISKGGLPQAGNAYLILGMSYYENHDLDQAKKAFIKAKNYANNRRSAEQWLSYLSHTEKPS